MKKRTAMVGIGLAACVMMAGTAMTAMAAQITAEKAKETALSHAGVAADQVSYITAKLDYEDGVQIYDVEFFTKDYVEYDYEIRVADGVILSYDYDAETSFWREGGIGQQQINIDGEKAKEIALKHAGKKAEEVTLIRSELEYDDGVALYDVKFYGADHAEYDYEISAYSGEIVSYDYEVRELRGLQESRAAETSVTAEDAKAAALRLAGISEAEADHISVHLDRDDGRLIYEGKIFCDDLEYEFEIDAASGTVLDWDVESRFD